MLWSNPPLGKNIVPEREKIDEYVHEFEL